MAISGFFGEYRWLSNYHLVDISYEGKIWPSTEHLYQALKTSDAEARERIRLLPRPVEAKRAGSKLPMRAHWDNIKISAMELVTQLKYENPELRQKLLDTGDQELIEENSWGDVFWGVCNGKGANNLGKVLMRERARLKGPIL